MEEVSSASLAEGCRKRQGALQANPETPERSNTPPTTGLLRLPFEIRLQIYGYFIPQKQVINVYVPCFSTHWAFLNRVLNFEDVLDFQEDGIYPIDEADHAVYEGTPDREGSYLDSGGHWDYNMKKNKNNIFLISKQISEESLNVLYGENTFNLSLSEDGERYLKKRFTESNRQRMRYLLLTAEPVGASYGPEKTPDHTLWSSILPQLKGVRIVAAQPHDDQTNESGLPIPVRDIEEWVHWIRPFLQCFGRNLLKQTIVQIDHGGRLETRALVKKYFPSGYREIRCRYVGDMVFRRGPFCGNSRSRD